MTNAFRFAAVAALASLAACGGSNTVCDDAADYFAECGIGGTGTGTATVELPDDYCAEGSLEACQSSCTLAAPCGALDGSDVAAATDWGTCILACSTAP